MPIGYISVGRWEDRHITRHDPARVLRGVEAKRRIVELCTTNVEYEAEPLADNVLRQVATEWSTHPDYRQKWAS